jgi:hypothetical protein
VDPNIPNYETEVAAIQEAIRESLKVTPKMQKTGLMK